jgi:uncharacterized protein YbjT (DUF2867 family)
MAEKNIIAVVGATGAQGGGLVRAILSDAGSGFAVRALTRNVVSREGGQAAASFLTRSDRRLVSAFARS